MAGGISQGFAAISKRNSILLSSTEVERRLMAGEDTSPLLPQSIAEDALILQKRRNPIDKIIFCYIINNDCIILA